MALTRTDPYEGMVRDAKAAFDQEEIDLDNEIADRLKPDWPRQFLTTAREQTRAIELRLAAQVR